MSEKLVYLTVDGKKKLEDELHILRMDRRQEIADRIQQAKQFGDITESGEYEDAKNEQAFIEGRIRELESTLSHAHTISNGHGDKSLVRLGSTVTIMDDLDKEKETWMLVGSAEADSTNHKVSGELSVWRVYGWQEGGGQIYRQSPFRRALLHYHLD